MTGYDHQTIEKKWQRKWEEMKLHAINLRDSQSKLYCLVMFSYPSAKKLHIGHWYNYGPTDTWARFQKMRGRNVFEPMGFDAFGLPAENQAVKEGVHPKQITHESMQTIRTQLQEIGAMYDWSKEIITSDPSYYKWTQWVFLQLYKKGNAYRKKAPVNWCPTDQTVLANEQVIDGHCERCGTLVVQKELEQWFFRITEYAEDLLKFEKIDWPERTILMQQNWIGKSDGAEIIFKTGDGKYQLPVYTTRPDTLFGATLLVLAPEHELVPQLTMTEHRKEVEAYVEQSKKRTTIERQLAEREKTGVFLGTYAVNPANGAKIPIWIADYVLLTYGSGIIMAVPGHDLRDFEFAKKYKLPIVKVIKPPEVLPHLPTRSAGVWGKLDVDIESECWIGDGTMINSEQYNGLDSRKGGQMIVRDLQKKGYAVFKTAYRLRDWLISRQRYWGAPIPIVYCEHCGTVPVPEQDLPVLLPDNVDFQPHGESPLARSKEFVHAACPNCNREARREADTMDTFVDSSWYFFRYLSPREDRKPFDMKLVKKWMPVDLYVGGAEHATMHLLYARFIAKVLMDDRTYEPFAKLRHQGTITKNGAKMSKSKGNVVNPDEFIERFGSDTFRMFLMFMGPYEEGGDWTDRGILGIRRFLDRVYSRITNQELRIKKGEGRLLQRTIKKVTGDIESLHFNTAIACMMEYINTVDSGSWSTAERETFLKLLAPFAPHLAEELWLLNGHERSIFMEQWPEFDPLKIQEEKVTLIIQVNGKVRDTIQIEPGLSKDEAMKVAQGSEKAKKYLAAKKMRKFIYVQDKLINFVV